MISVSTWGFCFHSNYLPVIRYQIINTDSPEDTTFYSRIEKLGMFRYLVFLEF